MKKQIRKLTLSRETVGALSENSLSNAAGGSVWSNCYCTGMSACCTNNNCPSALCW